MSALPSPSDAYISRQVVSAPYKSMALTLGLYYVEKIEVNDPSRQVVDVPIHPLT
jgi:hypothetical protein